jgi:hypothetical protein
LFVDVLQMHNRQMILGFVILPVLVFALSSMARITYGYATNFAALTENDRILSQAAQDIRQGNYVPYIILHPINSFWSGPDWTEGTLHCAIV